MNTFGMPPVLFTGFIKLLTVHGDSPNKAAILSQLSSSLLINNNTP
jgi:hypothetical protein